MPFAFPQFTEPNRIDAKRAWTARFDSYDQRNENCYYEITIDEEEGVRKRIMVAIGTEQVSDDDWTSPEFAQRLRQEIHRLAAAGTTNTKYRGYGLSTSEH